MTRNAVFASLIALGATLSGGAAMAQDQYPRVVGTGENASVEYGPGSQANIVGGGRVVVTLSGQNISLHHLHPEYAQAPRSGLVPVTVGSGENVSTAWVPAPTGYSSTIAQTWSGHRG